MMGAVLKKKKIKNETLGILSLLMRNPVILRKSILAETQKPP